MQRKSVKQQDIKQTRVVVVDGEEKMKEMVGLEKEKERELLQQIRGIAFNLQARLESNQHDAVRYWQDLLLFNVYENSLFTSRNQFPTLYWPKKLRC